MKTESIFSPQNRDRLTVQTKTGELLWDNRPVQTIQKLRLGRAASTLGILVSVITIIYMVLEINKEMCWFATKTCVVEVALDEQVDEVQDAAKEQ